jgi:hypothetical protein
LYQPQISRRQVANNEVIPFQAMLDQLHHDEDDGSLFIRELFRVCVRFNPANMSFYRISQIIEPLDDNTPNDERTRVIGEALSQVDLGPEGFDGVFDGVAETAKGFVVECFKDMAGVLQGWPRDIVDHPFIAHREEEGKAAAQRMRLEIGRFTERLGDIRGKHQQLMEFYPRYNKIMTRSSVLDWIIGFAAGAFGGGLGVAGISLWDDWRGKSANDFIGLFSTAMDQFGDMAVKFTQELEAAIDREAEQLVNEYVSLNRRIVSHLAEIAGSGQDISQFYSILHKPGEAVDEDAREGLEIVIMNLKDRGLSLQSEGNMRFLVGLKA